ncbi:MAG: hypothetical protein NEHIOOID_00633 [Holosporales bacterium]
MRKLFVLLVAVFISGCAKQLSYVEPTTGERSRVRFVTKDYAETYVTKYTSNKCTNDFIMMRIHNSSPILIDNLKQIGIPLWQYTKANAVEVFMDGNKDHYFMFTSSHHTISGRYIHTESQGVYVQQKLLANHDYEFIYYWDKNGSFVEVYEIVSDKNGPRKILLNKKNNVFKNEHQYQAFIRSKKEI